MALVQVVFLIVLALAQSAPQEKYPASFIEDLRSAAISRGSPRIVAGWEAEDGQIPYQVNLRTVSGTGSVFSCGGSVIHHEWIITAAHCLGNRFSFIVRLGLTNLTRPQYIVETTKRYIHPEYNEAWFPVQTDDIGLLKLDRPIPYGPYIQPCRLQNSGTKNRNYAGAVLTVSGYGLTDDRHNGGTSSEVLLWVKQRGISNQECLWWYHNFHVIQDQTICAASYNHTSQSACEGDSGGPLTLVDVDGKPTMVGIVSFGPSEGCNSPYPAAFVRPGHYHDWLKEVTGINFDWSSSDLEHQDSASKHVNPA